MSRPPSWVAVLDATVEATPLASPDPLSSRLLTEGGEQGWPSSHPSTLSHSNKPPSTGQILYVNGAAPSPALFPIGFDLR